MIKRLAALLLLSVLGALFASLLLGYTPDPALNPTALYYAERTAPDLGAANLVTAIVISYRGLDTLGEVTVLFLAAAIVGLVLIALTLTGTIGVWGWIGVVPLFTAAIGWCPAYTLLGIKTCPTKN